MKNILNFLINVGKLKDVKRKGVAFYGVRPDSATDHSFRTTIMAWLFGREKKVNLEKVIKIGLIHDLSKIFAGDITPYNGFLPKNKKERDAYVRRWRRLSLQEKTKRHKVKLKREYKAFEQLIEKLPDDFRKELFNLWIDYHKQRSAEARLVFQINMVENLLESFEWFKKHKDFPTQPWWEHADEVIHDPFLLDFLEELSKEELKRSGRQKGNKRDV